MSHRSVVSSIGHVIRWVIDLLCYETGPRFMVSSEELSVSGIFRWDIDRCCHRMNHRSVVSSDESVIRGVIRWVFDDPSVYLVSKLVDR